ncbi:MAG: 3-hydroxyacyl-ACP dehydratase FabZ [Candidatus Omnitrophica bacterium]|nr:3-hydroxyacyl-ACP dehydratase FabZ [Candidatus Omnitrophota bacterium]MBU1869439.1 3-hydroxyacyl-ACP dehydratase FabZ [Candidatus Omnitrophota bacterium]
MYNIEEIQKILPQRFPFLMIDRIIELEPGAKVVAIKNVSVNEEFFSGHFPDAPVMPGVLIIEAMAQASIMLFAGAKPEQAAKKYSYYLGNVKIKFLNPVFPGDQIRITVVPVKLISTGGIVNVTAQVSDKEVARGELSISVKEN